MRRRLLLGWCLTAATWWAFPLPFPPHLGAGWPPVAAGAASLEEVVERVQTVCAQTQDLSARFQQTATNRTLNSVQEASGVFLAKRPGKMRWEYQKPDARLFVTDGKTLWAYSPSEKQVVVQDIAEAMTSRLPLAFLAGNCALAKDFDIGSVEHAGTRGTPGTRILDLTPKRPEAGIARMLLEVSVKNFTVEKTTLFDAYGNTTTIALSQLKLNGGLDDQQFRFAPPPGVNVVAPGKP
jgi:outer membrane lipoprotein carrier protein